MGQFRPIVALPWVETLNRFWLQERQFGLFLKPGFRCLHGHRLVLVFLSRQHEQTRVPSTRTIQGYSQPASPPQWPAAHPPAWKQAALLGWNSDISPREEAFLLEAATWVPLAPPPCKWPRSPLIGKLFDFQQCGLEAWPAAPGKAILVRGTQGHTDFIRISPPGEPSAQVTVHSLQPFGFRRKGQRVL